MTIRGPIAHLPLVAEEGPAGPVTQALVQSARFDDADSFFTGTIFVGPTMLVQGARFDDADTFPQATIFVVGAPLTLVQIGKFNDPDTFPQASLIGGSPAVIQTARFDDSDTFFTATIAVASFLQPLVQTARFDDPDIFFSGLIDAPGIGRPDQRAPFPPDGSSPRKKQKPRVKIKMRDTVAEAAAAMAEERRLAEIAQLNAMAAYLDRRRKIAAITALLLS